jgi:hypothetical protein
MLNAAQCAHQASGAAHSMGLCCAVAHREHGAVLCCSTQGAWGCAVILAPHGHAWVPAMQGLCQAQKQQADLRWRCLTTVCTAVQPVPSPKPAVNKDTLLKFCVRVLQIKLINVSASYFNPSPLDTCEQYNTKAVFALNQAFNGNVMSVNKTGGKLIGPLNITVLVIDAKTNTTGVTYCTCRALGGSLADSAGSCSVLLCSFQLCTAPCSSPPQICRWCITVVLADTGCLTVAFEGFMRVATCTSMASPELENICCTCHDSGLHVVCGVLMQLATQPRSTRMSRSTACLRDRPLQPRLVVSQSRRAGLRHIVLRTPKLDGRTQYP